MPRLGRAGELYSRADDRVGQRASPINKPPPCDIQIRSRVRACRTGNRKISRDDGKCHFLITNATRDPPAVSLSEKEQGDPSDRRDIELDINLGIRRRKETVFEYKKDR